MADAGKKKQKKKGKTLNLNEFLSSGDTKQATTFAKKKAVDITEDEQNAAYDSEEELKKEVFDLSALPTAPRAARSAVDPKSLPSEPPYTAFLGNLSYDVEEDDIIDFFANMKLDKVRLPREGGRIRGFGYAEFVDVNSLVKAIELNNEVLKGRRIRVDIAGSGGTGDGTGREESREERSTDWRKKESGDFERRPFESRSRDGGRMEKGDGDSPWRSSEADNASTWRRGDTFESSRSEPRRYESRGQSDRSWGDSAADSESTWRRGSPNRSDDRRRFENRDSDRWGRDGDRGGRDGDRWGRDGDRGGRDGDRGGRAGDRGGFDGEADSATSWRSDPSSFRSREPTSQDVRPQSREDDNWKRSSDDRGDLRQPQDAPRERPKLNLKPRTVADVSKEASAPTSSIFGGARPVDTATKEIEIEKKLLQEQGPGHNVQNGSAGREVSHNKAIVDNSRLPDSSQGNERDTSEPTSGHGGHDGRAQRSAEERNDDVGDKKYARPAVPHYEEPQPPVFVQKSVFSVLPRDEDSSEED